MATTLIGSRIREHRQIAGLTQKALAQEAGISASYLNLIEHNRRGIAGKPLQALARVLNVEISDLTEGVGQALVSKVREAAAKTPGIRAEIPRTEDFVGRFPGFAGLVETLFEERQNQAATLAGLTDRLAADPFFAEAIHLMLSNVTAIQSTAELLSESGDIPPQLQRRFLGNLTAEAKRMSQTALEVLDHYEPSDLADSSGQSPLEEYLLRHDFHIDALETGARDTTSILKELGGTKAETQSASAFLEHYSEAALTLPLDHFLEQATELDFDPVRIAAAFDVSLSDVFFRLAHLAASQDTPDFGYLECDGSGAVLKRRPLPSISLPRTGAACPLWPIYRAMAMPMHPLQAFLDLPTGERFMTWSFAQFDTPPKLGLPGTLRTTMLITPDYQRIVPRSQLAHLPQIAGGVQCSVCQRKNCTARRNPSVISQS